MERVAVSSCDSEVLAFRYPDPERRLAGVRLLQGICLPTDRLDFSYDEAGGTWWLRAPRPPVWRVEYQFELRHADGGTDVVCDPGNPRRVGGAFGDKSVLECPEYTEPTWLRWDGAPESERDITISAPAVRGEIWARIWSPTVATDRILIAHDGPEFDRLAGLTQYSAAMVEAGRVPPHHLVLLSPGARNEWYSANPAYARALTRDVLLRLRAELGTDRPVVGLGASLGALALLHAQRRYPKAFAGLFLQSGSFFQARHDSQESGFGRYQRIVRFVGRVLRTGHAAAPVRTVLTCGKAEENIHNNRDMAQALSRQGYPAELFETPDAHNFVNWRDALDPHLTGLLRSVWAPEPQEGG